MEITLVATSYSSRLLQKLTVMTQILKKIFLSPAIIVESLDMYHTIACFIIITHLNRYGDPKEVQVILTLKDPKKFGYLKGDDDFVLQEHRKKSKGKWYLDSGCSNHMTRDKNLFKSVVD